MFPNLFSARSSLRNLWRKSSLYKKQLAIRPLNVCHPILTHPSSSHRVSSDLPTISYSQNFPASRSLSTTKNTKNPKMRAAVAVLAFLAAVASARFDGNCTDTACGEANVNCDADGMVCVPFPVVDVEGRIGCTCSIA
ncbi:hypothetical protein C8034_v000095 [Colletotrichum sidae]|uniref:Uncharacterized protein n=1 Tax=Colletotrichum sidae TaxID=1347389 RepID=A0A4R8SMU0_9PEZI|nr:hypothetical protein C8034_v000095 [Colletotrichum sidae]